MQKCFYCFIRYENGNNFYLVMCKAISKATYWILENTMEVFKSLYYVSLFLILNTTFSTFMLDVKF